MNHKFVVITSINPPTDAVRAFAQWPGWTTIVVGDRKSPPAWAQEGVVYLSLEDQHLLAPGFAKLLPENTYVRKMVGYAYAFMHGAEAIFESDDDNIPYSNAVEVIDAELSANGGQGIALEADSGWVNVYEQFGATNCWPRGFPLNKIQHSGLRSVRKVPTLPRGVVQYLADEDPDVDAVYRMTNGNPVFFSREKQYAVAKNNFCPFNSQATLWTRNTFPLMFLPLGVKDRITDILRGYIALSCLWANGMTLAYASPVVYQVRNEHNLQNDFEQEIDLYRHGETWCRELATVGGNSMSGSYSLALNKLIAMNVLPAFNRAAYDEFLRMLEPQGQ